MEAEDTMIKLKQLTVIRTAYPANDVSRAQMMADQKRMKEQAKISFKAGIKTMFNFLDIHYPEWQMYIKAMMSKEEWQAKLKSWGIKED